MLKFKEMIGALSQAEQNRWEAIKEAYNKNKTVQGSKDNPMVQVVAQLSNFSEHLKDMHDTMKEGLTKSIHPPD